jgi:hypothetical protein
MPPIPGLKPSGPSGIKIPQKVLQSAQNYNDYQHISENLKANNENRPN